MLYNLEFKDKKKCDNVFWIIADFVYQQEASCTNNMIFFFSLMKQYVPYSSHPIEVNDRFLG